MVSDTLVTDPFLLSVLDAADKARQQSLAILEMLDRHHTSDTRSDDNERAILKEQKTLHAHLAVLRGLNRKAVLNVRHTKQETSEARQEIDALHLQLQNLYYKQSHLKGETIACERYEHKYQQLSMIPQDEFLASHPEHASLDEHELTIARIEDEHSARQALEEERQALQKRKEALVKVTNDKKEQLAKLDAEIEKWLDGELSIRKLFDARAQAAAT